MEFSSGKAKLIYFLAFVNLQLFFSFNLDTSDLLLFSSGKHGYYFGFSVALHKHKGQRWMIVGAPIGNDTSMGYKPRYGSVYKCDLKSDNRECDVLTSFDSLSSDTGYATFKTTQWLGATVRSRSNYIMACAPRFAWSGSLDSKNYYPIGKCEIIDSENVVRKWIWMPCGKVPNQLEKTFGYCQFGFDADFNSVGKSTIAGAPLLQNANGRLIGSNVHSSHYYLSTVVGQPKSSDYLGYSVTFGRLGSSGKEVIIAGAPNGDDRKGKVIIFKFLQELPVSTTLKNPSKQIGSFFGASLAAADVNGDGYEDLIVCAPMFSILAEEGAAFVYINNKRDNLDYSPTVIYGESHFKARFGTSIASAKDLNNDGFEDVVIGAPFGGEDGRGVVYVYQGSRNGIQNKFSQKITPSQFGLRGLALRSFGASLAAGVDVDDNGYPDLAVGSFLSDHAVFIKSRPVVITNAVVTLQRKQINPKLKKYFCVGPDGKTYICLGTQICFWVGGKNVLLPVEMRFEFILDDLETIHKRGVFFDNGHPSYRIVKELWIWTHACVNYTAYLNIKPRNVYSRISFKVLYNHKSQNNCHLCPIMRPGVAESMASYTKHCGPDLVCDSDLGIEAAIRLPNGKQKIHVGVDKIFNLEVTLTNSKENAFLSMITVFYQMHLLFVGVHFEKGLNVNWNIDKHNETHNALLFDAGNPVGPSEQEIYNVKFAVDDIPLQNRELYFEVKATTNSRDMNTQNNKAFARVGALIVADMTVSGVAIPDQLTYTSSKHTTGRIGPLIEHKFLVQNKGPSTVESSTVSISFPEKLNGDYLMNLIAVTVEGPVNCNVNESLYNPLELQLQPSRHSKDSLSRKRRSVDGRLDCTTKHCQLFKCDIGRLKSGESVGIFINSSLVELTIAKSIKKDIAIVVRAVVASEEVRQPVLHFPDSSEAIVHILSPKVTSEEKTVPWWIILISVIAGLCLVAGVVFVLQKSGFFDRKKRDYSFASVIED